MRQWISAIVIAAACGPLFAANELSLQNFDTGDLKGAYLTLDTQVKVIDSPAGGRALSVVSGTKAPYPNVRLNPAAGAWDLSAHTRVELDITNTSEQSVKFTLRIDNAGATGRQGNNTGSLTLDPGETGTLVVRLQRPSPQNIDEKLIGMDRTPWGRRGEMGGGIDVSKIVQANLFVNKPDRSYSFTIDNLRATGEFNPSIYKLPEPFLPFIDTYGQYIHADWPGKVKSDADLIKEREEEAKSIADFPRPQNWNKYGGWKDGPKLKATGHFATVKREGKWHLVDPEGNLFFSVGIDTVQSGGTSPIDEREDWFQNPAWEKPEFKRFVAQDQKAGAKRSDYAGKTPRTFDFFEANLLRKYGEGYEAKWQDLITKRMMNWGFNTMGCWAEPKLFAQTSVPFTHWVFNDGPRLPWRQGVNKRVPDPWDPEMEAVIRRRGVRMTEGTVSDSMCIGYFVDNEIQWGTIESLAETAMMGDDKSAAKTQLVADIKAKYGEIAKLNAAWDTKYESWDTMLATKVPNIAGLPQGKAVAADFAEFGEKTAEKYFSTVKKVLKDIAPNKLYLGCRFADYNPTVVRVAAKYCDVVSFNLYRDTVANWAPPGDIDAPIIIGEFHFGARDRGVFGDGLVAAESTRDRADKFQRYLLGASRNPRLVGAHWFQLCDEPTTGRTLDGENHNIGFLAITDRPYQEMIDASRAVAGKIYAERANAKLVSK